MVQLWHLIWDFTQFSILEVCSNGGKLSLFSLSLKGCQKVGYKSFCLYEESILNLVEYSSRPINSP